MDGIKQRSELQQGIWKIAEDLRGSVDGWDFKTYVLGFLFYRFISENLTSYINAIDEIDYANSDDSAAKNGQNEIVKRKGFFILPSNLFKNIIKEVESDSNLLANLNERLQDVFNNIQSSCIGTESEENFKDLFKDIDVNSNKLGNTTIERNKKLYKIMQSISNIQLNYNDNKIDAFGDAYEFLMKMYASNAGKSGGEFFTPQEVSKLLVEITLHNYANPNKVYDPACGSGSLLLQYKKALNNDPELGYFGQEINLTTYNLARMNMFLHNVGYEKFNIAHGDTLTHPCEKHKEQEPFDAIVSNPPYSTKWEGKNNTVLINDERFNKAGVLAPRKYADFAFVMHILSWLSEKGSAAIVCFPGIMYRTHAEEKIRKYLVEQNYIDSIISLADNLFFGTTIPVCIMVLRKNKKNDNRILFINATKEFEKATNQNILNDKNINNIIELYKKRKNIEHISKLISKEKIRDNNYNLSVSNYIEKDDKHEIIDINKLNNEIKEIFEKQNKLRKEIDAIVSQLDPSKWIKKNNEII